MVSWSNRAVVCADVVAMVMVGDWGGIRFCWGKVSFLWLVVEGSLTRSAKEESRDRGG